VQSALELAFLHSPLPQLLVNPTTDTVDAANTEASKLFGFDQQSNQLPKISQLFPESFAELVVFTQEAMDKGQAWSDALHIQACGSSRKTRIELSAKLIRLDDAAKLQLTLQDADALQARRDNADAHRHYRSGLGQWKRMTRVFQEFEHENRLILDAAGEGIYGVDNEGRTTFMNPAAERLLGWSPDELIGKTIHSVIHYRHPDGSHFHAEECPIYQAFREGTVNSVEDDVFWRKDGKPIDVEYTSTPIRDSGHVVGAVVIFRDVTEKKSAQQKLLDALQEVEILKQRLEMENAYLQEEINSGFNHHRIIGSSAAVQNLIQKIELVAPADVTVLISGESGTGKELIARAIHELSQRSKRSLIRVNCAAVPADLFESEFFGHAKGAFTGATSDRPGRFELADGGTLFLDEVGEIPLALQGKLLRVLQEQQFERVGESATRLVDVRIIAATNRDLEKLVAQGEFREDLYFRLNVMPVESVPLRQRINDIPLLAQHFLQRASTRANKTGLRISLSQIEHLKNYSWPGNIRELENIIERQVILARDNSLRFDDLVSSPPQPPLPTVTDMPAMLTEAQTRQQDKQNIIQALKLCRGKVFGPSGAADLLGIKPTTLASRIKRHQITPAFYKNPA